MIVNFLIQYCKYDALSRQKMGKRQDLNDLDTKGLMSGLNNYFELIIEIPRMKVGRRQTFETVIS